MTCPMRDDLYRYPWPGITDEERRSLRQHTSGCEVCRATAVRLGDASELLADDRADLAPARRVALWSAIEAKTTKPRWGWPALAFGAALAVTLLVVVRAPREDRFVVTDGELVEPTRSLVSGELRTAATRVRIERAAAKLELVEGTVFAVTPRDFVRVERGRLELQLQGAATLDVEIPVAHVAVLGDGAAATIDVDDEFARVEVRRGRARVTPRDGAPQIVEATQRWTHPPPEEARKRHRAELDRARSIVADDAPAAQKIAQAVLEHDAGDAEAVDALALIADAYRRSGEHRRAADFYAQVAAHPAGRGYAEEALLRRAKMLRADGDEEAALAALEEAAKRFADGPLAPERVALTVRTLIAVGRYEEAARRLEGVEDTPAVRAARVELEDARRMKKSEGSGYP